MTAPTDVAPEAGWYRDAADPAMARWWDGSAWSTQTQPIPPPPPVAPPPVAPPPTAPPVAVASIPATALPAASAELGAPWATQATPLADPGAPWATAPTPVQPSAPATPPATPFGIPGAAATTVEPLNTGESKRSLLQLPQLSLLVVVALLAAVVVVVGGGWYAWTSLHGSSSSADVGPVVVHHPVVAAKHVRIPATLPAQLAGLKPVNVKSAALNHDMASAVAVQTGWAKMVSGFYGTSAKDRFAVFLWTKSKTSLPLSAAAERTYLFQSLNAMVGLTARAGTVAPAVKVPTGSMACISGRSGASVVSLCSWQDASSRVVLERAGSLATTEATTQKVLAELTR
jgi:Protein of unknown function (DUF2510)